MAKRLQIENPFCQRIGSIRLRSICGGHRYYLDVFGVEGGRGKVKAGKGKGVHSENIHDPNRLPISMKINFLGKDRLCGYNNINCVAAELVSAREG